MKKWVKKAIIIYLVITAILLLSFIIYVSNYYKADETATNMIETSDNIKIDDDMIIIGEEEAKEAIIFYPGGKVEYTSYVPILEKLNKETGLTCILVKMPFNLAVFDVYKADDVMKKFPNVSTWYIGGHSLGGAMASDYASKNKDKVDGLILLASYIYGDFSEDDTITVYGKLDTGVEEKIDYTKNVVGIDGGNHAQFGNYGEQKGDAKATISREEQQDIAVTAIKDALKNE